MTKPPKAGARTRHDRRAERVAAPVEPAVGVASTSALFRPTLHDDIRPDPHNPRRDFQSPAAIEALRELRASILRDDLLEPLVLRPVNGEAGQFMLIAGERRWMAIGDAIADGEWPADKPIPCMLRRVAENDARRLALIENLQRRDLSAMEEARAVGQLMEMEGKSAAQIGRDLGFSERWAQQRLSLLKLPDGVQRLVETGRMTVENGRELVSLLPKLPAVQQVAIADGRMAVEAAKAWLASQPKPLDLTAEQWLLALEVFDKSKRNPIEDASSQVEVHADGRFDERVAELRAQGTHLLHAVSHVLDDGGETGRFQIGVGYDGERLLRIKFGDSVVTDGGRLRALDALYADLGVAHTPPLYRTAWLNGPFEISDGLRQEIAAARVARAERDVTWKAERDAEEANRGRVRQAHIDRMNAVRQQATMIAAAAPADRPTALADLARLGGHALPWSIDDDGSIVDDGGGIVRRNAQWQLTAEQFASLQLIVAIANAGAGLVAPDPTAQEEEEEPAAAPELQSA